MMPVLFRIPILGKDVPGYGLMLMIGFLLAVAWAVRRATRSGANPDVVLNCGFISLVAGVVGCRIMYVIHYWPQFAQYQGVERIWRIIDLTQGGLEFYGGFVLTLVSVTAYLYFWKHSLRWYFDIMAPSAAVGMALGRVGCFLNGCCWGGVCELPWSVEFPYASNPAIVQWTNHVPGTSLPQQLMFVDQLARYPHPIARTSLAASDSAIEAEAVRDRELATKVTELAQQIKAKEGDRAALEREIGTLDRQQRRLPFRDIRAQMQRYNMTAAEIRALAATHHSRSVHPTQLYSTAGLIFLALLLNAVYWRRSRDGQVIFTLLLVEPVSRWLLEVIRADNPIDTLGFTVSQFIAICLTLTGLIGLVWLQSQPPRSPAAVLFEEDDDEEEKQDGDPQPA